MTLSSYLRIFRERWRLVALVTLLLTLVAVLYVLVQPRVYQADAQVFVASSNADTPLNAAQAAVYVQTQVATYAAIVDSPDVLHAVRQDLNLTTDDQTLKAKISATSPNGESLVIVHATDGNAAAAAALANSAARAFASAVEKYTTPASSGNPSVRLFVTGPASEPSAPVTPRASLDIAVGFILGLLLGAALAVAREVLDNRVKDPDVLSAVSGAPVMGLVIEDPKAARHPIATRTGPRSTRAENYRQLRANLQFANVDDHPRIIAVTSSVPGEGKTTIAINLASTLAEAGFSVCLVDTDLRRPAIADALGLVNAVGLTSVLVHQVSLREALQSAGTTLSVLTSGPTPPNPSEVLASTYVRDIVRSLLDEVDYVVLDTAPLLPVADGSEVCSLADGTLLVARYGATTDVQVRRAVAALNQVDAKVIGTVLNRVPTRRNGDYDYGYYDERDAAHVRPDTASRSRTRHSRVRFDLGTSPLEQEKV